MYGGASLSDQPTHQRAVGELRLSVKRRDAATVLDGLRQSGCLKARFPRPERGAWMNAVTLNTSGGVAGGDRLSSTISAGEGTQVTIAAQAAERFYRALPGAAPAQLRTRIAVGAGASFEWLPQETIFFDRCAMDRRLEIDLAPDAWFLGVESLVFGRAAMGETVEHARIADTIRIRRDGRLLLHDAIRIDGEVAATLRRPAIAGAARAVATLLHVAPDAETALDRLRGAFEGLPATCAASAWDGMLIARIIASSSAELRAAVTNGLQILRNSRPMPRVWLC